MAGVVKRLSQAARAPGAPKILGEAADKIISQADEIERLRDWISRQHPGYDLDEAMALFDAPRNE